MDRIPWFLLAIALCASGCKKEVKEYTVSLDARCWECIVTYAAGPDRGRVDTLFGSINGSDTLTEVGQYQLILKESDNLFFRACRLDPDTSFGDIELHAGGGIQALSSSVGRSEACATINQPVVVVQ